VAESKLDLAAFVMQEDVRISTHGHSPARLGSRIAPGPPGLNCTLPMAQSWPYPRRSLRLGAPDPRSGQTNWASRNPSYR
jgi:hypothetical protein